MRCSKLKLSGQLVGLGVLLSACGQSPEQAGEGHGLLVISVDGLRADHLELFGYGNETAPALAGLGADGFVMSEAFAASPRRLPSHASILTGCDPLPVQRLVPQGVDEGLLNDLAWSWSIPDVYPSLAVEFLANGWETGGFFDHANLNQLRGFGRGFAHYGESLSAGNTANPDDVGLSALSGQFLQWLRGVEDNQNWFAYIQVDDLERSWSHPSPQWERYFRADSADETVPAVGNTDQVFHAIPRDRWRGVPMSISEHQAFYDGHVRRLDNELQRLLAGLDLEGVDEQTTVVIVGSYGVQFGEAGRMLASGCYSMADLHVPWVVRPSKALRESLVAQGTKLSGLASNIDLAPTLLDLSGLSVPHAMHGVSQLPVWKGEQSSVRTECFASLSLLGGWAAIGPEWVLERLDLDGTVDTNLVRAWAGAVQQGEPAWRTYNRTEQRFPALAYESRPPESYEAQRLLGEGKAWFERLNSVRELLRGSLFERTNGQVDIDALEREGWIQKSL